MYVPCPAQTCPPPTPPISQAPKAAPPSSSTSMHTAPPRLGSSAGTPHAAGLGLGPWNCREIPGGHPNKTGSLIVDNNNSSQPLLDSPESIKSTDQKRDWNFIEHLACTIFLPPQQSTSEHLPHCPIKPACQTSRAQLLTRTNHHLKQHSRMDKGGRAHRHATHTAETGLKCADAGNMKTSPSSSSPADQGVAWRTTTHRKTCTDGGRRARQHAPRSRGWAQRTDTGSRASSMSTSHHEIRRDSMRGGETAKVKEMIKSGS
jgi:hypothetical protein